MALVQGVRRDLGDALKRAQDGDPDRVMVVQGQMQVVRQPGPGRIVVHLDLLADDAPLLFHALGREIGRGHKPEQQLQILVKGLGTVEIVGRDAVAGKGVGACPGAGKGLHHVHIRQIEHLVLQIVGHPGGAGLLHPVQEIALVHGAVVRGEHGKIPGKAGLGDHPQPQAV